MFEKSRNCVAVPVDVATSTALPEKFRAKVLAEAVPVLTEQEKNPLKRGFLKTSYVLGGGLRQQGRWLTDERQSLSTKPSIWHCPSTYLPSEYRSFKNNTMACDGTEETIPA